jgi:indolepyruvate ferredoxin oxidoreductase alpha subunit
VAERSFRKEVQSLKLGNGDYFHGEAILAVTKALLQSGVSYVGGYPGAPVSHLIDVLGDSQEILSELGVHFETPCSEATAAAMLAASINYPLRGAVTWKSTVGTNVASDALANLSSAGVMGGALVIVGEDYGEGSSVIQERSHAFAMKSQMWLLDPRPNLPCITKMIETGFELSEASNTPVFLMLRIRACHVTGSFAAKDNVAPRYSHRNTLEKPIRNQDKINLPPNLFNHEKQKAEQRRPAALEYLKKNQINEFFHGEIENIGIILQGGMYNLVIRALERLGLSDPFGHSQIPLYVMNATYPLVGDEITKFCVGKTGVLLVEEGHPNFIEQEINTILRKADIQTHLYGKGLLPEVGEYTGQIMERAAAEFILSCSPNNLDLEALRTKYQSICPDQNTQTVSTLNSELPDRPAGLCIGCPERPLFSAIKQIQLELGEFHINSDIGCTTFATLPPFYMGNHVMGYGLSLASSSAVRSVLPNKTISIMGDGGFWHNGLSSGVTSAVFNHHDSLLIIVKNGFAAATGGQDIPSYVKPDNLIATDREYQPDNQPLEQALRGVGVKWIRTVSTYDIDATKNILREALTSDSKEFKVVIAEGECMLNRQRRIKPQIKERIKKGVRTLKQRFVVDSETCTGDHACMRISGCPSLTIRPNPDPLRLDPVAYVDNSCVACGVCGENAHSAILCPSFARTDIILNPSWWDRLIGKIRQQIIGFLQQRLEQERKGSQI